MRSGWVSRASRRSRARSGGAACGADSRTTSSGARSSRIPLKADWRISRSAVQPPNSTSQTSRGAAPVRQIAALGDDAFEAEAAGMLEHGRPVPREMLAEADRRGGGELRHDLLQQGLAIDERRLGEIEPFAIQEIEQDVAEAIAAA